MASALTALRQLLFGDKVFCCWSISYAKEQIAQRSNSVHLSTLAPPEEPYEDEKVVINVSGERYEVFLSTLRQFPLTLLGGPELHFYYDKEFDDYFFDRNREAFIHIFDFYRTGKLYIPRDIPSEQFNCELEFFGLVSTMEEVNFQAAEELAQVDILKGLSLTRRAQMILWTFFDNPQSSIAAQFWAWMDISFIFVSVAAMFIETTPPIPELAKTSYPIRKSLETCELSTVLYFTVDLLLRGVACPQFLEYIKSPLTWVDTFAVSPFFVALCFPGNSEQFEGLRVLRVARVMRVLKLVRRSKKLMTIATVMKSCISELILLIVIWTMGVIVFASLMYTFEEGTNPLIVSVFDAAWWAVVTMSTVGYGDIAPITVPGKLVGTVVVFMSMIFLALPLTIIVSTFSKVYGNRKCMVMKKKQGFITTAVIPPDEDQ